MNGSTHGLRGHGLLLRGESQAEYEAHVEAIVFSLTPVGAAETLVAAEFADCRWVRLRWMKAMLLHLEEQAETATAKSPANLSARQCSDALTAINGYVEMLQHAVDAGITTSLEALVRAGMLVFGLVSRADPGPVTELELLHCAIERVGKARKKEPRIDAVRALLAAAITIRVSVEKSAKLANDNLARVRQLCAEAALPDAKKGRQLERYRRLIDNSGTSLLDTLAQLQRFRREAGAVGSSDEPLSAEPAELRLRIVR